MDKLTKGWVQHQRKTTRREAGGSSSPTPGQSRARPSQRDDDFVRSKKNLSGRQLWTADHDRKAAAPQGPRTPETRHGQLAASATNCRSPKHRTHRKFSQHHAQPQSPSENAVSSELFRQSDTRLISSDELAVDLIGIYDALFLLEKKCIEYDNSHIDIELSEEQYYALIALHSSLLDAHYDFLLASQHPSASDALRRLAADYGTPTRMWRHGIRDFLELLRSKLKLSLQHMLKFIHIAYGIVEVLYVTVPAFEDTWMEFLGNIARYRMAVEDDDIRDRQIWTGVSRDWYIKASDKAPTEGRLYHHLAIIVRPNALQQLYFYAKSLCVLIPFLEARNSIMSLFQPLLTPGLNTIQRLEQVDVAFIRVHGILFSGKHEDQLKPSIKQFLDLLDSRIGREHGNWLESG